MFESIPPWLENQRCVTGPIRLAEEKKNHIFCLMLFSAGANESLAMNVSFSECSEYYLLLIEAKNYVNVMWYGEICENASERIIKLILWHNWPDRLWHPFGAFALWIHSRMFHIAWIRTIWLCRGNKIVLLLCSHLHPTDIVTMMRFDWLQWQANNDTKLFRPFIFHILCRKWHAFSCAIVQLNQESTLNKHRPITFVGD